MVILRSIVSCMLVSMLIACGGETPRPKRIVLITLDTLRWDAFEGRAGRFFDMPLTARWAEQGRVFERHYSTASSTQPTHVTLLTGQHPWEHGITRNGLVLGDAIETIPEKLQGKGFRTAAVVASFPLHEIFGFAQGFDQFVDDFQHDFMQMEAWSGTSVPDKKFYAQGDFVTRNALQLLDASDGRDEFIWLHYFDPHAPYGKTQSESMAVKDIVNRIAKNPERSGQIVEQARRLYDADVQFMDRELDRVLKRLKQDENEYETHIFVTADHGESFGESGVLAHGSRLSEEQIHVPLIVYSPLVEPGIDERSTGSIDVGKAILSIAGLSDGLHPVLLDSTTESPGVFGMRHSSDRRPPERRTDGRMVRPEARLFYWINGHRIVRGDSKLIHDKASSPQEIMALKSTFSAFEQHLDAQSPEEIQEIEAIEALRGLGYLR